MSDQNKKAIVEEYAENILKSVATMNSSERTAFIEKIKSCFKEQYKNKGDILIRRMGLSESGRPETLQQIADSYGVSRERIRQLEMKGMRSLKSRLKKECPVSLYQSKMDEYVIQN